MLWDRPKCLSLSISTWPSFSVQVNVYKQPITDSSKNSKKGLLSLEKDEKGKYITIEEGRGNAEKVSFAFIWWVALSTDFNAL